MNILQERTKSEICIHVFIFSELSIEKSAFSGRLRPPVTNLLACWRGRHASGAIGYLS